MRKALSKRLRFEIFKRDGFKCLYCGVSPTEKVLRVDHVKPVVDGGGDEPANLVTSCFDCNSGKGPVPLEKRKHAAGIATAADKEHAEQIREWLKVQREIEEAKSDVVGDLLATWEREVGDAEVNMGARIRACLSRNSVEEVREAIYATAAKHLYGNRCLKYFYGVLRAKRGEAPEPEQPAPPKSKWSPRANRVMRHMAAWQKEQDHHTLDDVFHEFAIAAWASPDVLEYAKYTTEYDSGTELSCRGLVLRTKPVEGTTKVSWWVEDDLKANIGAELIDAISLAVTYSDHDWAAHHANGVGAPLVTLEEARASSKNKEATIADAREFLEYLSTGNEASLRACREHYGWPCPEWRSE